MDFLNDTPDDELLAKVSQVANFFDTLATAVKHTAGMVDDPVGRIVLSMVATTILAHGVSLFENAGDPDTITTEGCYDLLFRANDESVAFVVELEQALAEAGVTTLHADGRTPSEVLRQVITA